MIADLMNWNMHQEYQSPYNDGYVSHLIFKVKLHNNDITVKCNGYVTGNVEPEYKNGKTYSIHYNIISVHKNAPASIKNIEDFENTFYNWININSVLELLKTW